MEKSKVEFVYKNISSLNKISIVNKKIFRILPYICVPSLVVGGIAVFLKEMLPIKGVLPDYIRLVCLVIFFLTFLMWLVSFFFEYIFPVFYGNALYVKENFHGIRLLWDI